jgi:hypothetical protein
VRRTFRLFGPKLYHSSSIERRRHARSRINQLDREWDQTTRALERFSAAFADVPVEELEAKIDQIIAEGRANDGAERRSA